MVCPVCAGSRTLNGLGPNAPGRELEGDASSDRSNGPRATARPVDSSASATVSALRVTVPRSSGGASLEVARESGRLVVPFA